MPHLKRNIHYRKIFFTILILIIGSAVAQTISRSQLGSSFDIRYGTVAGIERVKIKSQAAKGAITGGMIGGATSGHRHRSKHAVEGAIAGALLAALLEGNRKAFQYTVNFADGSIIKVVTESGGIVEGDCVTVEIGHTANIRRVSTVYCEHGNHEAITAPIVQAHLQQDAAECHAAKEMALQATTSEATDIALKKVRAFCEH